MKNIFTLIAATILIIACNKKTEEQSDKAVYEIDKAIELTLSNKSINDTLLKYRQEYGVDFILCYSIVKNKHRSLGF